jgi:hypothetical protein
MSKKIAVVDEDLPRIIDDVLRKLGWEVKDVRDHGLRGKSDDQVIKFAKKQSAVMKHQCVLPQRKPGNLSRNSRPATSKVL